VQKEHIDVCEVMSHSFTNICLFKVVVQRGLMATLAESMGSGEKVIMWALHLANDWRIVRPSCVNPP
jgi:hypothetical protein